jgi:hypothetical protein
MRWLVIAAALFACDTAGHVAESPDAAADAAVECAVLDFDICGDHDPKDYTRWYEGLGDRCELICCEIDGMDYRGLICGPDAPPERTP